jgi:hypothetical protein
VNFDIIDDLRGIVSKHLQERVESIFAVAIELPGFVIAAASRQIHDEWRMSAWSLESIAWHPQNVGIALLFRATCGELTLLLPVNYITDMGMAGFTVTLNGVIDVADEEWEALRANVRHMAQPQALRTTARCEAFSEGSILLLDAVRGVYVLVTEGVVNPDRVVGVRAVSRHPERFEPITHWP